MFAEPSRDNRTGEELDQIALLGSSLSTTPTSYHNVVIYGDNSLPGASPLSQFFQAFDGEIKSFN